MASTSYSISMPFFQQMEYTIKQWLDQYLQFWLYLPALSNSRPAGNSFFEACSVEHINDKKSNSYAYKTYVLAIHIKTLEVLGLWFVDATKFFRVSRT